MDSLYRYFIKRFTEIISLIIRERAIATMSATPPIRQWWKVW